MNSAKLLNLCHELSGKQIFFFLSFSRVFNFGNPLSSSCEHRKSPEVIKRYKGHFNGKSHCRLKWTSTSCDVGSFVRGLDMVRLCLRVDVEKSAFKAILTDPSQPLTLAKSSRGWCYMSLLKKTRYVKLSTRNVHLLAMSVSWQRSLRQDPALSLRSAAEKTDSCSNYNRLCKRDRTRRETPLATLKHK